MQIFHWMVALFGAGYSFWYAYYLIKDKNKPGALGLSLVGMSIIFCAFIVRVT